MIDEEDKPETAAIPVFLRPMTIMELEDERRTGRTAQIGPERILAFVAGTDRPESMEEVVERYRAISTADLDLMAVPAEKVLLDKIIWPLKSAKVCYCLGQYLACIATCGLVGEMYATLIFQAKDGEQRTAPSCTLAEFENYGQKKRIAVLHENDLIDDEVWTSLKELQGIRRGYLHRLSRDLSQLPADAKKMFVKALKTFKGTFGLKPITGGFQIDSEILAYLRSQNV